MKLIPFTTKHFEILINWIVDEDTMLRFAGIGFSYPLTSDQLRDYIQNHSDRLLYLALDDFDTPIAYGEIIPQDFVSARLGHLIIGDSRERGKGLGQKFISLLIKEGQQKLNIKRMDLYLLEGNLPAQKCYLKYGFQFIPNNFKITSKGQDYQILKMSFDL